MRKRRNFPDVARRNFLKSAGVLGAATLTPVAAKAQLAAPKADLKAAAPGPRASGAHTAWSARMRPRRSAR